LDIGIGEDPEHTTLDTRPLQFAGSPIEGHGGELVVYFRNMAKCLEYDTAPKPDIVDGSRAVAVGVAAQESLRTGRAVPVQNQF